MQKSTSNVSATLYSVYTSHPAHAARLMLEYKGIEHKLVSLVPGLHPAAVRSLGFRSGTVPALKLDGRRIQGTRAIARALDDAQPKPPLFPADPRTRVKVEEAEGWGDEILQPVPRRLGAWLLVHRPALRTRIAREAGLPAASLVGTAGWPVAWWNARKVEATELQRVRMIVKTLPALLDHVDELLDEGTIGGEQRNAADFQLGTSVRLLMTFGDLEPVFEGRKAAAFATELMPDYPTGIPAGAVPAEWLESLSPRSRASARRPV